MDVPEDLVSGDTQYCLLGSLVVRRAGELVPVPAGQQRMLLAALALRAGQPASADELAQALWGTRPPASVRVSLQNAVMRLRRTLGAAAVVTEPGGYRLAAGPGELDVTRFESALAAGRAAARAGSWAQAARVLADGLALWRGEPLAGVGSEALAAREVPRLTELRLQALELRIDADLHLGRAAEVIAELGQLAAAEPLRERLHALLMTALYRSGQQAGALAAYQAARHVLIAELGAEPGPELRRLHQQILAGDLAVGFPGGSAPDGGFPDGGFPDSGAPDGSAPDGGAPDGGAPDGSSPGGSQPADGRPEPGLRYSLPPDAAAFAGRGGELKLITAAAAEAGGVVAIRAIDGMPGIGKTTLAVHAAHVLRDRFPDRQLFLDLHGHTPGREPLAAGTALAILLAATGADPRYLPDDTDSRAALWRDKMEGQRALLVLDNAASSAQVAPLLPGGSACLVLVTSRRHLADLPGPVVPVLLEVLPPDQAAQMLTGLAPRAASAPPGAVAEVAGLAGFLPLAISLLARVLNRHPAWTLADLAAETRARLLTLSAEHDSVAAAFEVSYLHLPAAQQGFFRLLGLHPGTSIDPYAAAALAGVPVGQATRLLDALHGEGLLTETGYRRYGMHDLIRRYAAGRAQADPAGVREQALARLLDYYQHAAARADALLARQARPDPGPAPAQMPGLPDSDRALAWLRAERASLLACLDQAGRAGQPGRVVALAAGLAALLRRDGPWADAIVLHAAAAAAARQIGDRRGEAGALAELGAVQRLADDYPAAAASSRQALRMFGELGDRLGQAGALHDLGVLAGLTGDYPESARLLTRALELYRAAGDRLGEASALFFLGAGGLTTGDHPAAARLLTQALGISRDLGDRLGQANALSNLGYLLRATGDYPGASRALQEALDISRATGNQFGQAIALASLGAVRLAAGDYPAAARTLAEGLATARAIGDRLGQTGALTSLGKVRRLTGDYPGAIAVLDEALELSRELGSAFGQAGALVEIGAIRRLAGDRPAAAQALSQALGLYRDLGDPAGQASALNEQGMLHLAGGDPGTSADCHRQSLKLAREIGQPREEGVALAGLARCALSAGDPVSAEAGLREAGEVLARIGAPEAADVAADLAALLAAPQAAPQA